MSRPKPDGGQAFPPLSWGKKLLRGDDAVADYFAKAGANGNVSRP